MSEQSGTTLTEVRPLAPLEGSVHCTVATPVAKYVGVNVMPIPEEGFAIAPFADAEVQLKVVAPAEELQLNGAGTPTGTGPGGFGVMVTVVLPEPKVEVPLPKVEVPEPNVEVPVLPEPTTRTTVICE